MNILKHRLALACTGLLAFPGSAFAHAHLKSASPAINGTVATSPTELDLMFSEGLNLKFTGLKLMGPDKKVVPAGDATLGSNDSTLVVPVTAPLGAGTYKVDWHALSTDGHKTSGSYTFTIRP